MTVDVELVGPLASLGVDAFTKLALPVPWKPEYPTAGALLSPVGQSELNAVLGSPGFEVEEGLGPERGWGLRFACGLEVVLVHYEAGPNFLEVIVPAVSETEHALRHLGELASRTTWRVTETPEGDVRSIVARQVMWTVWRQDDNGHRFEVCRTASERDAECIVGTYAARGHKQMYWAERTV